MPDLNLIIILLIIISLIILITRPSMKDLISALKLYIQKKWIDIFFGNKENEPREPIIINDPDKLKVSLITFFDYTASSRQVLKVLVQSEQTMTLKEIVSEMNKWRKKHKQLELDKSIYQKITWVLMVAGFISFKDGQHQPTDVGKELIRILERAR